MSQIVVDRELCKKDGACVAVCPSGTLALNGEGFPEEVPERQCILCGHCVAVCASDALKHTGLPEGAFLPAQKKLPEPEAMDDFLNSRRSVREFKAQPVARETLEALLDVARRAPTASNSQKLHWIVVGDAAKVRALSEVAMNYLRDSAYGSGMQERWDRGEDVILRGAPALIVACAPEDYAWGKEDGAIALTFLELAAEARGLGVCWGGFLTRVAGIYAPLREALGVPEGYAVRGVLMLGERRFRYKLIPPRKPLSVQWM